MADKDSRGLAVPRSRIGRMARFGGLASGIAGNMVMEGAKSFARGDGFDLEKLALNPRNAAQVAEQLARLRGAAMKVGQMLSMDGNDMLPPEFADVLARLREGAHHMPPKQLRAVLNESWGQGWLRRFEEFNVQPIAAASIGQVHRAKTADGRDMAIKVQYPGVRESIDSDVDNVSTLVKMMGVLPKGTDISPLLDEAKRQLHEEADYIREGEYLMKFREVLSDDGRFILPELYADFTTRDVLAMSYVPGVPIESLESADQETRDRVVRELMELVVRELFGYRMMQTDPNFANYRFDPETGRIVLLDFGATRTIPEELSRAYLDMADASLRGDRDRMSQLIVGIGFMSDELFDRYRDLMLEIFDLAIEPYRYEGAYDFGASDLAIRLRDKGLEFRTRDKFTNLPPTDTLFIHRKIGGIYLLARRLKARVDVRRIIEPYFA